MDTAARILETGSAGSSGSGGSGKIPPRDPKDAADCLHQRGMIRHKTKDYRAAVRDLTACCR
jgi:hypothetical protein